MTAAFYLPLGLEERLETIVQRFGPPHDALELHLPVVELHDLLRWIDVLREAREANLARRPMAKVIRSLDDVTRRFLDPRDAARREAVESLARAGRFTAPMMERALDDAFQPLARGGLRRWVSSELGSTAVLDRPVGGPGGLLRRAHGPEWMLQIYAGNVPTLPIWPMYSALLLKSALLAKTSAQEPLLAPLIARTIAEVDENLGACLAVVWWKGGTGDLDRTALSLAPAVLAFGGDEAIASVTRQARPGAALALHGPKVSACYIERRSLTYAALRGLAARAALDVSLYDQQGCLSPHAFYLERRGEVSPEKFAAAFATALEIRAHELPRGVIAAEDAARVQLYRAQARFEAAGGMAWGGVSDARSGKTVVEHGGAKSRGPTSVLESPGQTTWTVVFEERARFEPGPSFRTVRVHAVEGPEEFARSIGTSIGYVEAVGLEARGHERARLSSFLAALGIPRVTAIGQLQRPTPLGTHGGVRRLLPFVTWSTVEGAASHAASFRVRPRTPVARPSAGESRRGGSRSRR